MNNSSINKWLKNRLYIQYSIIFMVISFFFIIQLVVFNKTMVWNVDGYLQWYSLLVKLRSVVADVIHGNGFDFWSWDTGLGADWIGNYSFIFFDPFNYIAAFFSRNNVDIAYTVIVISKLYFAGVSMLAFLKYHKKNNRMCIMGAISYALCSWAIVSVRHDFFVTQLVLFPLLILGVDKVDDKKSPLTLIFSVFFSVIISLYFSYMSAIFVVVYIVIKYFANRENKSVKEFIVRILKFALYAVTGGVLLAAPALLPVFYALSNASTEAGVITQILPSIKEILRFVPSFGGSGDINSNYAVIGMNSVFVLMVSVIIVAKKKTAAMWMCIISFGVLLLPILQSVLNGFSYPSGRWCYCFAFFFAFAAVESLEIVLTSAEKYRKIFLIEFGIIICTSIIAKVALNVITTSEMAFIFLNLFFGLIVYYLLFNKNIGSEQLIKRLEKIIYVNIALFVLLYFNPYTNSAIEIYTDQGWCYEAYESSSLKAAKDIDDEELYRSDTVWNPHYTGSNSPYAHTPVNTNIYWQVPSVSEYLSTIDNKWLQFNDLLGNNNGYFKRMCSFSNDNRTRMEFLLGVKYYFGEPKNRAGEYDYSGYKGYGYEKEKKGRNGIEIYKSKYNTGLGYVFENVVSENDLLKLTALEREQALMQCVEVPDDDVKSLEKASLVGINEIALENNQSIGYSIEALGKINVEQNKIDVKDANSSIKLNLDKEIENSEIYVTFYNLKRTPYSVSERIGNRKMDTIAKSKMYLAELSEYQYNDFTIDISRTGDKGKVTKRLINAEGSAQGIFGVEDYMSNLGYVERYSGELTITFNEIGKYTYDRIEVTAVPMDQYDVQAAKLEKSRLNITDYDGDYVNGNFNTAEGGLLYLSVLYHDGWSIYIDGKKTDKIYKVNTAFTGVEVEPGYHEIELKYHPVGYPYTMVLFAVGIVIVITIAIYMKKKHKRGVE